MGSLGSSDVLFNTSHSEIAAQQLKLLETAITPGVPSLICNGTNLNLAAVAAVARFGASVEIDTGVLASMHAGFEALVARLADGEIIYGVNTLFGGSANLRTQKTTQLQQTLIREFHYGILPDQTKKSEPTKPGERPFFDLTLESPAELSSIPHTWARAAVLIRLNSLVKGYSGVRPVIAERLKDILKHDIIPIIPLRGSISASGDLSPLSYIAGAIQGKRTIRVFSKTRPTFTADRAFAELELEPIVLQPKEGLAIMNGTAVSCAAGALTLFDAHGAAVLAQVLTAMAVESLRGTVESFDPMFTEARPHPGQIESARNILHFLGDSKLTLANDGAGSSLRQDRYSIRTAPQWIGPVLEDLILAHQQMTIECNSATDNPLVSPNGAFLNGGNFQAKAVTSAMEKTRQGLHSIGRMIYVQCTEIINPATNRGLCANLVAEDPSTSFIFKGIDIGIAALVSELGFLATPVDHVQSAEMGNQALNSLALISARYTSTALEVLSQLLASAFLTVCQALDLRALTIGFLESYKSEFREIVHSSLTSLQTDELTVLEGAGWAALVNSFDATASMDASERFQVVARAVREVVLDFDSGAKISSVTPQIKPLVTFLAESLLTRWTAYRDAYLVAGDATPYLGRGSKVLYTFIRRDLGVPFLHTEKIQTPKMDALPAGHDHEYEGPSVGHFNGIVYRAIRDGRLAKVAIELLPKY